MKEKVLGIPPLTLNTTDGRILKGRELTLALQDIVDVDPVGLLRGDPPRRGMRLEKEPLLLKIGHFVPYGGGTSPLEIPLGKIARPHGFVRFDVFVDHRKHHFQLPF
jgi:hypothetical protein